MILEQSTGEKFGRDTVLLHHASPIYHFQDTACMLTLRTAVDVTNVKQNITSCLDEHWLACLINLTYLLIAVKLSKGEGATIEQN